MTEDKDFLDSALSMLGNIGNSVNTTVIFMRKGHTISVSGMNPINVLKAVEVLKSEKVLSESKEPINKVLMSEVKK